MNTPYKPIILVCLAVAALCGGGGAYIYHQTKITPGADLPISVPLLFGAAFALGVIVLYLSNRKT